MTTQAPAPGGRGKTRKPGRPASADPRERISLRLNAAEARVLIDAAAAAGMPVSTYIRSAAMGRRLVHLPAVNRQAWADLAKLASNFNQGVALAHTGRLPGDLKPLLVELSERVRLLRLDLVAGAGPRDDEEDVA